MNKKFFKRNAIRFFLIAFLCGIISAKAMSSAQTEDKRIGELAHRDGYPNGCIGRSPRARKTEGFASVHCEKEQRRSTAGVKVFIF